MIHVSAIICSHNPREPFLRRVLEGLRAQTLPAAQWELLVIDNVSADPLASRFDISWHPNARHVREELLGLTPARLRGILESTGEILIFVDDDAVLAPDYLEQALAIGKKWPFVGTWGGSVIPEYETPLPEWVGDQVWRLLCVEVKEDVWSNLREGHATLPCGAGLCIRRHVAQAYLQRCQSKPPIAVSDRKGNSLSGYGDIDMSHSALDLGLGTGKSTSLQLTHLVPSSRLTLDYFVRHAEGDAASMVLFRASRSLPITPPKPITLIDSLRWFVHRLIHKVPREQYEISKAYHRGLAKGWAMVQSLPPKE